MLLVFALLALIWWGGAALRIQPAIRNLAMLAVLVAAIAVNHFLPDGHVVRQVTGQDPRFWYLVLLLGSIAIGYGYFVKFLRREAVHAEEAHEKRAQRPQAKLGPVSAALASPPAPTVAEPDKPAPAANKLGPDELNRYARHIVLREIGGPGQKALKAAHVVVIGAGGLGSPALLYLAAAGVGRITVVDDDTVDVSNLQRQVIHRTADEGRHKAESAIAAMQALNPHVEVRAVVGRLSEENGPVLVADADVILDGTDNFETRYLANALAVAAKIPLVSGALSQWEGQISVFDPANGAPCYRCIFPEPPAPGLAPSCSEAGVMGPLPGVVGAMMAAETVKLITGAGASLRGGMLIYDALWGETRRIGLQRREGCPVCGETAG